MAMSGVQMDRKLSDAARLLNEAAGERDFDKLLKAYVLTHEVLVAVIHARSISHGQS